MSIAELQGELSHFNHLFTSTLKRISLLQHKKDKHQPQQQLFFWKTDLKYPIILQAKHLNIISVHSENLPSKPSFCRDLTVIPVLGSQLMP